MNQKSNLLINCYASKFLCEISPHLDVAIQIRKINLRWSEDHCIFPLRRQKFKEIKNIYGSPSPYSKLAAPDDYMEYRNDTFKISQGENASCP